MSQETNILSGGITRRTLIKTSLGLGLFVAVAGSSVGALVSACAGPASANLTVASSTDFQHSHNVTVPGADIDKQPSQVTYTTDGATHTHRVTLTSANFKTIKDGQSVSLACTSDGTTPHTHTFVFKKA